MALTTNSGWQQQIQPQAPEQLPLQFEQQEELPFTPAAPEPAPKKEKDIYDMIAEKGGPSRAQIEEWKRDYVEVNLLPATEEMLFIYRPLRRLEWNQLKDHFAKNDKLTEDQRKDMIVNRCLLWPAPGRLNFGLLGAGLVDSLNEAVMLSSCFFSTSMISNMTIKL